MKKSLTVILVLFGCGGGGGSGQSAEQACAAYCNYACSKAIACLGSTQHEADVCGDVCLNKILEANTQDAGECNNAETAVGEMSCAELFRFLGLAKSAKTVGSLGAELSNTERMIQGGR